MERRIDADTLREFARALFAATGMPEEDAATEAEVLIWANLRGVDSHGVLRIPQYMQGLKAGVYNVRPQIRIERETPAVVLIEADHAFGPVVTSKAMRLVMDKARQVGIGWALIRNTTHQGAMGYYALMAAREGLVGIALVCSPPNMAPYGARARGVHNSPIAIAVPTGKCDPLVLDMATSVAAWGKVALAVDKGVPIPEGWAVDADGNPTTDPRKVYALLPFGGYKGSSLAMIFECLSSIMAGVPLVEPALWGTEAPPRGTQNSVVAAIDVAHFIDVDTYRHHVDRLIEGIKGLPPAEGFDEVMVPGEPEARTLRQRQREGIPLPEGTIAHLQEIAQELGVPLPEVLA